MHSPSRRRPHLGQLPHRTNHPKPHTSPFHIASRKQLVGTLGGFYLGFQCAALFYEKVPLTENFVLRLAPAVLPFEMGKRLEVIGIVREVASLRSRRVTLVILPRGLYGRFIAGLRG